MNGMGRVFIGSFVAMAIIVIVIYGSAVMALINQIASKLAV